MAALGIDSSSTCLIVKALKQHGHMLLGTSLQCSYDMEIRQLMVPMHDGYKAVMNSNFNSWGVVL
jgi:hypothetical protein